MSTMIEEHTVTRNTYQIPTPPEFHDKLDEKIEPSIVEKISNKLHAMKPFIQSDTQRTIQHDKQSGSSEFIRTMPSLQSNEQ